MGELEVLDGDAEELMWQERALCAQTDPEAFFPEKGGSTREAKRVCLSCDVRGECLEYALFNDERFGIWGGLSERERRKLKKRAVYGLTARLTTRPLGWGRADRSRPFPTVLFSRIACRHEFAPSCCASGRSPPSSSSHDGERWIPQLTRALEASTRLPDRIIAVDTGSTDSSRTLLVDALGADAVVDAPPIHGFGPRSRVGLERARPRSTTRGVQEWVWLLHDDCSPSPEALEQLLRDRCRRPRPSRWSAAGSGPGRELAGCSRSASPSPAPVTARPVSSSASTTRANTTASVRCSRSAPRACWSAATSWTRSAASTGGCRCFATTSTSAGGSPGPAAGWSSRPTPCSSTPRLRPVASVRSPTPRRARTGPTARRRCSPCSPTARCSRFPFQYVRLFLGSLIRALGYLVGKLPGAAYDEVAAMASVLVRPDRIVCAPERRVGVPRTVCSRAVRPLLPAWYTPYLNGIESVLSAFADRVRDTATNVAASARRLRSGRSGGAELETGRCRRRRSTCRRVQARWSGRCCIRCGACSRVLTCSRVVATRGLWGGGLLQGGALLPAPDGAGALVVALCRDLAPGRARLDRGAVAVRRGAGDVRRRCCSARPGLLVDLLMLLAVPLSCASAPTSSRAELVRGTGVRVWMSVSYALLPVVTGAVDDRAHRHRRGDRPAALAGPVRDPALDRGRHRGAAPSRAPPCLRVMVAFCPIAWVLACRRRRSAPRWLSWPRAQRSHRGARSRWPSSCRSCSWCRGRCDSSPTRACC